VITGLTNGKSYKVALRAVNAVGAGAASNVVSGTPAAPGLVFVPIDPVRVLDTRTSQGGIGPVKPGEVRVVSVANQTAAAGGARNVVPAGSAAIAYNVTVPGGSAGGELKVTPADVPSTITSAVAFRRGETIAKEALIIGCLSG
jgi:predicted RNA-binding protein with TRAM domain